MNQVGSVKSAQRVFMILQDFSEKKRAQRAAEVARSIGAPISSCVALLSTMVDQGALFYDETSRSYVPTIKIRNYVDWLGDESPLEKKAIYLAKRLYRELGTPVAVTRRAGLYVEWRFTLGLVKMSPGDFRPLCKTINGRALLSYMSDAEIAEFVSAHNECFGREHHIEFKNILDRARAARSVGYASGVSSLAPGFGAICFAIEDDASGDEVLLTLQVPAAELRLKEQKIVDAARRMILDLAPQSRCAHRLKSLAKR